jgi:hypothetical protein
VPIPDPTDFGCRPAANVHSGVVNVASSIYGDRKAIYCDVWARRAAVRIGDLVSRDNGDCVVAVR